MFARLTGKIDEIRPSSLVLDVGGVGYLVTCSGRTLAHVGGVGEFARLHIETHVREDAINLYGFVDQVEQAWFNLLTTVQGVGARVAMNILSACTSDQMAMAIGAQDKTIFTHADGVGPKLATRIITELKDKVPEGMMGPISLTPSKPTKQKGKDEIKNISVSVDGDVLSALVNLGYGRAEAFSALMRVKSDAPDVQDVGTLIRLTLAELGRG